MDTEGIEVRDKDQNEEDHVRPRLRGLPGRRKGQRSWGRKVRHSGGGMGFRVGTEGKITKEGSRSCSRPGGRGGHQ